MTVDADRPFRVLFLCTGNSARSQIAEAMLSHYAGDRFEAKSAGTRPAAEVHPLALEALRVSGIEWEGARPKSMAAVQDETWDLVVTVCDRARESCPTFPGQPVTVHWSLDDPAAVEGPEETRREAFCQTAIIVRRRIDLLTSLRPEKLERLALKARLEEETGPKSGL